MSEPHPADCRCKTCDTRFKIAYFREQIRDLERVLKLLTKAQRPTTADMQKDIQL